MPTVHDYYLAAQDLMADGDPSRVTIEALCQHVGTTSGSFYHHFGSHDGFVAALSANWVERITVGLKTASSHSADLATARRLVHRQIMRQSHEQEAAFRAWARNNLAVRQAVEQVDKVRSEASKTLVKAIAPTLDARTASDYAEILSLVLIGAQAHDPTTSAKVFTRALTTLASLITHATAQSETNS